MTNTNLYVCSLDVLIDILIPPQGSSCIVADFLLS